MSNINTATCRDCGAVGILVFDSYDTGYSAPEGWEYRYFGEEDSHLYCPKCVEAREEAESLSLEETCALLGVSMNDVRPMSLPFVLPIADKKKEK